MKNIEIIRSLGDMALANILVVYHEEQDFDYDSDEAYPNEFWETSDGKSFVDYEDAIEHEVWWLNQECEVKDDASEPDEACNQAFYCRGCGFFREEWGNRSGVL